MRSSALLTLFLLLALGAPAGAQERADTLDLWGLPPAVAERVTALYDDPATIRLSGETRIPAERVVSGDVVVLGGPLVVAGRIEGEVVVVRGSVELLPGAVVEGGLTVVDGEVSGAEEARVGGEVVAYSGRLRSVEREGRPLRSGRKERERGGLLGRSTFLVTTGRSYNRVEGLPILFGPLIETAGSNPFRLRALAVYRTEEGTLFETDLWGHQVTAEQFFGGRRSFRVGAGVHSVVDPIEGWHLSDTENGLSTLLFHRDFRDHYERKGWSAHAVLSPAGSPFSARAEYRSERHRALPVEDPFAISLFNASEEWRAQPRVGEGELRSVLLAAKADTRNDRDDPSTGWYARGEVERAVDSELVRPALVVENRAGDPWLVMPLVAYPSFTSGFLDLRRYNRISPDSRLNLRLVLGGSLDGSRLPPQRQHALGGEGTLPGYSLFQLDCGARALRVVGAAEAPLLQDAAEEGAVFFPAYGCDRFALLQAEYRGKLSFRFDWGDLWGNGGGEDHHHDWDAELDWVSFVDVGRGWGLGTGSHDEETAVDAGIGLLFDRVGVYAAVPLRNGRGVNLFVRLGPRF